MSESMFTLVMQIFLIAFLCGALTVGGIIIWLLFEIAMDKHGERTITKEKGNDS